MCAFKWQDHKASLGPNFYVQPKLNGVRALYHRGQMQSRGLSNEEGKIWNTPVIAHLLEELNKLIPPFLLTDGELYLHGKSLQQINLNVKSFARLATQVVPLLDNMYLEYFFFFVPNRLVWDNWEKFNGAQDNPGDSTSYRDWETLRG